MAIGRNNSPARSRRTGNSPAREPQTPRSGGSSEPNWSTTLPKAPVPSSRVPNPAPPPLGTFPTEILAPKSYVSFESEPTPGWLARNATVPAQVVFAPHAAGKKLSIGELEWVHGTDGKSTNGSHAHDAGAAPAFQGHGAFSHLNYPASGVSASDAMPLQNAIQRHSLEGVAGHGPIIGHMHPHAPPAHHAPHAPPGVHHSGSAAAGSASAAPHHSHLQQHANLMQGLPAQHHQNVAHTAHLPAEASNAQWIPPSISLESALSDRYLSEHVPGHAAGMKGAGDEAMRRAFETQNRELMRLAASAERRAAEMESANAQLSREVANMKDGMHLTSLRANEEAMIRISQLQMQLAQSQSEAATSADINAEHMRTKMQLTSESESLRAEIAHLCGKLQSTQRGSDAEVQALVSENIQLNRSAALNGRDLSQLETDNKDLHQRLSNLQMTSSEGEHQRRRLEEEASFLHEQIRLKSLEVAKARDEASEAVRTAEKKILEITTEMNSRIAQISSQHAAAVNAARDAAEREQQAAQAIEHHRSASAQEAEMLRRENVRLQVTAASATSSGDELVSLRRQLRELTVTQDEARAQMEALKSINESLTKRNVGLEASIAGLQGAHEAMGTEKIEKQRQMYEIEAQVKALETALAVKEKEAGMLQVNIASLSRQLEETASERTGRDLMERNALERNVQALAHDKELALTTGEKIAEQLRHLEHHGAEREREYQRVCAALHEAQVQLAVERVSSTQEAKATELSHGRQTQERAIAEAAQLVRASNMSKANSAGGQDAPRDMGREDALAVTRRLLDLERGTGKLLRERNNDLETRARNVQVELDEFVQQMQVLKRQLSLKDAQIAELKTITVSWMGTGGGDSATRTQGLSATTPAATRSVTDGETDKSKSSEILQRIYRGTKLGVGPASITLFFRKEDESVSASLPFAAPPTYQDILRQPSLAPSALSTEREVCNVITSELGIAAETVAPVFIHPAGEGTDSVGGGRGWGVGVMGMLVLASNQVLQAQGLYQVSDDDTPPGICRRLCELFSSSSSAAGSMSSHTALSSNLKIRQDLGVLERVEVAVVQTSSSEDAEGSTYPIPSNLQQKLQDLHERAQAAELSRNELLQDNEHLRNATTALSRQVDDADGSSALTIPREKLEDVLRDAQERIDIAEARCEQLTVQVLLLQSTDGRGRARARDVPFPRRNSGDQRDKRGRGAQFEAVYDEDCLPVSELEWRDEDDDVSRPFSSQSIKYKGQGHGGNRDSHVSNESGVFPSDIHRSGELYLNQDMEDFGEDEQWLDERHEVYDDGIDTVGDLPVVDKMRVRHFSFGGLRSKQGPLSRTTSDESNVTEGESVASEAEMAEMERERAMERERKRVSKIRESARADVDYHSQFNSEHLHWDPL